MKPFLPHEILSQQFKVLQKQNPRYSMRSVARELGLSASFVSEMLSGKKPVPANWVTRLKRVLKMDEIARADFDRSIQERAVQKIPGLKTHLKPRGLRIPVAHYDQIAPKHHHLLTDWFNVALMDLVSCTDFTPDPGKIAARLGIKKSEAEQAFQLLKREGFVNFEEGRWIKTNKKIRFPTRNSMQMIRRFHGQMIQIALRQLLSELSDEAYNARLINGITFSANPAHLERAKQLINDALYQAADTLTEGECTEVYQLNCQLVPLTKSRVLAK
jgi:uncharacterized protein (TIGR02147 family)